MYIAKTLLIALTVTFNVFASDQIDLADVPWTDSSEFWTRSGDNLPAKNKNLLGNAISIGFVKYDKGITGRSGLSIIYNLSEKALRFTSVIGIDDEEHKLDPKNKAGSSVNIVILVDRKEVLRKTVFWKDKGIPVSIDLTGKHQMELRGEHGKTGFFRQRPVFANPILEVKNKKNFLNLAEKWGERVKKEKSFLPQYPPPPKWNHFKIEKKIYKSWENAYWISNAKLELIILPEFGGRIMSFKLKGAKNILKENAKFKKEKLKTRGYNFFDGGHFNRPQPINYFITTYEPTLLFGNYSVKFPAEGEILLTSPKSWMFFLQYKFKIKISPNKPEIEIINTQKNIGDFPLKAGIWSITRLNSKMVKSILMPLEAQNPVRKYSFEPTKYYSLVDKNKEWLKFEFNNTFWKSFPKNGYIEWKEYPAGNKMAFLYPSMTFVKSFAYNPDLDSKFMESFYPAHLYISHFFIEAECHGPTKKITPDEQINLKEKWEILK